MGRANHRSAPAALSMNNSPSRTYRASIDADRNLAPADGPEEVARPYHVVFTLPAAIGALAFHNKAAVYDLLF